jgi:hypothetical protein
VKKEPQVALAVKGILDLIKKISPGKSVELRIPPYGAIQCVAGSNHKRGTPPNTVEMSAQVLIELCYQPSKWAELVTGAHIAASEVESDLSRVFIRISQHHDDVVLWNILAKGRVN